MKACPREQEILTARKSGYFESESGAPLRAHLAECESCTEAVLVAHFFEEHDTADITVPSAALVWWKAQLRARREAAEQAMKPVSITEKIALACALIGALASLVWIGDVSGAVIGVLTLGSAVVISTATAVLCVMGFALYSAFARK